MAIKISEMTPADTPLAGDELLEVSIPGSVPVTARVTAQDIADLAPAGNVVGPASATDGHLVQFDGITGKLVKDGIALDTDGTLAADSDTRVATQKAVKTFVNNAVTGLWDVKGATDCSANPNYPAASKGDAYAVSVAGKIGGASGTSVDVGDVFVALLDNAGGTEAAVGVSWFHIEHNLVGVYIAGGTDVVVADGGTGVSALTAFAPIFGGTTSTGAVQSGTVGTAGQVLASNGPGALPTMQSQPFDLHAMLPGIQASATQLIYRGKLARAVAFAANFSGSYFTATANATGSTAFDVQKNGSSIGTVTIAAGGTTPTFTTSGGLGQAYAAGDVFAIYGPATPDATLADASFTFAGTR
jgi:hypothetical protein